MPAVVDADALNILSAQRRWPATFSLCAVLTPHPGEMSRLAPLLGCQGPVPPDDRGRKALATRAARACGQVVLLKGHRTVVADGRRVYVNHTGDSSLSKAGSGDVLAGILGCLLAQGMEPFDAACLAAHLHGRAGELAGAAMGRRCALARDVIAWLPKAIRQHERGR
jgi:NAD(P)H-hydrate epimerase